MSTKVEGLPKEERERIWQLMKDVNADVLAERVRQNKKWGHQRHDIGVWLAIIGEEWGEVCQASGPYVGLTSNKQTDAQNIYEELLHLSATAQALAEQIRELDGKKQ